MSDIVIRPFRMEDADAVAAIADEAWRGINASYRKLLGDEVFGILFPEGDERKGREMRGVCARNPESLWVAVNEDRVVGFVSFHLDAKTKVGTLGNNAVASAMRGRGVAQRMYAAVLDHFRREGIRCAAVRTGLDEGHVAARRAYEKAGFNLKLESVMYYRTL